MTSPTTIEVLKKARALPFYKRTLDSFADDIITKARPTPEVKDAPAEVVPEKRPEDMTEDELIATLKPLSPGVLDPTPAPAAASDELVERLRAHKVYETPRGNYPLPVLVNPDGPEAAARIEADAAELARLRSENAELVEALRLADRRLHDDGYTVADPVTMTVMAALSRVSGGGK